jgi:VanZ family protein
MGIIFYTSSIPGTDIPYLFSFQDIIYHFIVYLILCLFFSRALKNSIANMTSPQVILFSLLFGIGYGISDEFHQLFVPYRSVSGFDVLIDGIGSFVGSLGVEKFPNRVS